VGEGVKVPRCGIAEIVCFSVLPGIQSAPTSLERATMTIEPEQCQSMAEIRAGVDAVDREIVALLGRRFRYMAAAARVKSDRATVRDEVRKAEVIANAKVHARELGVPEPLVAAFWEMLVESSISYELALFDAK
jgi:isochorismate pyruvate lyase